MEYRVLRMEILDRILAMGIKMKNDKSIINCEWLLQNMQRIILIREILIFYSEILILYYDNANFFYHKIQNKYENHCAECMRICQKLLVHNFVYFRLA